jgi:hypothetical protein
MEEEMAYRELFVVEVKEVLRLWARGHGLRHVARATSLDRKTVRRYVAVARALGLKRDREDLALDDFFVGDVVASLSPGAKSAAGPSNLFDANAQVQRLDLGFDGLVDGLEEGAAMQSCAEVAAA